MRQSRWRCFRKRCLATRAHDTTGNATCSLVYSNSDGVLKFSTKQSKGSAEASYILRVSLRRLVARLLTNCDRHFANMHFVHEVVFIWNGAPSELPSIPRGTLRPIRVRQEKQNSLNNRWNHTIYPQTDGVLMVDDDQFIPLNSVLSLFARWQHEPDRVVSFDHREQFYPSRF